MSRKDTLTAEFSQLVAGIDKMNTDAEAAGGLTAEQKDAQTAAYSRIDEIEAELKEIKEYEAKIQSVSMLLGGKPTAASLKRENVTVGEYISEYIKARESGTLNAFVANYANEDQATTDNAVLVPEDIVGPLIDMSEDSRPVFNSFTSRPMPAKGKSFVRPRIVTHVAVGEQMAEFDAVASRKMGFAEDQVDKRTFAGSLGLSQQNIDWTEPSMLQLALSDFASEYNRVTEEEAVDFLVSHTTHTSPWDNSTIASKAKSIVNAAYKVKQLTKSNADTLYVHSATAADLAGDFNSDQSRSAGSLLNEALSNFGVNLRIVLFEDVAPATPSAGDPKIFVANSRYIESYEQRKGLLEVVRPTVLAYDVAYSGYIAFYSRPEAIVKVD